jgi:2-polyprenyl-3-methyl-5-hydroxy-6-metoxy-1,4-benzoquinol methylase
MIEITNMINETSKNSGTMEMEVRFGTFEKKFSPSISLSAYDRLDKFLKGFCSGGEILYEMCVNYKSGIKVIEQMPVPEYDVLSYPENGTCDPVCMKKKQVSVIDVQEIGVRLCLSKESETNFPKEKDIPVYYKTRKRTVYKYKEFEFHLSVLKSSGSFDTLSSSKYIYEIEMEVSKLANARSLIDLVHLILKVIHETDIIATKAELDDILKDYLKLTQGKMSKPFSITHENYNFSGNENYAVTVKLDGERKFLYVLHSRIVLINSKKEISITNWTCDETFNGSIFDTEFYKGSVYLFDCLFYKDKDTRKSENLQERLDYIKEFTESCKNKQIIPKEYHFGNTLKISNTLLKKHFYGFEDYKGKYDGIIYTPLIGVYSKVISLKWKPQEINTIDFLIQKVSFDKESQMETWNLYSYDSKGKNVLFSDESLNTCNVVSYVSSRYTDNTVVEFAYDIKQRKFTPIRQRLDKYQGNNLEIAEKIFESIIYPFNFNWMKGNTKPCNSNVYFFNCKRFIHYIKRILLNNIVQSNLLDIGCGEGDDLYKFVYNGIRNIHGIDTSPKKLEKFNEIKNSIGNSPTTKNFEVSSSIKDISKPQNLGKSQYDIVTCFDVLNHTSIFSQEDSMNIFFDNLSCLKPKGILIIQIHNSEFIANNIKGFNSPNMNVEIQDEGSTHILTGGIYSTPTKLICSPLQEDILVVFKTNGYTLKEEINIPEIYSKWTKNNNYMSDNEVILSFSQKFLVLEKN